MKQPILILGLGNLLMGDEGLGVHFARQMELEALPDNATVLDGGTGGFHLMSYLEDYPTIIAVDATLDDHPPGTIRLIHPRFSKDFPKALSTHDIGLKDLLEGLQILGKFPEIHLFIVSIETVQPLYIGLSPSIEAIMPDLIAQVKTLVATLNERVLVGAV
ncbi:MAG: hydrogenase maturation protease [Saprospiraceae bacterium]|nr:hydrogenase maturation protease [Saprospiraceae bacterium]